ncbi:putative limb region 1 protein -like isoform 2 [Scophthalmus maximus]|uniref:Putative limb region 1 protein-like isoform 2 n=1 Tax=Scophthalmus maximus TaxID=52904 RepID=A0A2U9CVA9_SCOMX|nr:putative limb region 1 protein -like isoform 2 [Scophthalmus maximus]
MEEDDVTIREQNFHSQVREYIICFLLFAVLYIVSYCIITRYKRKSDDHEDEDAVVNRISLYLCTFTLAVSGGAVFLLPFSIISNEILLSFPKNYYIQWLNGSLIHGLWNLVSLFSNLCLFVLMPFAYFFLESEGFAGSKKILEDLDEQIYCIHLQEEALQRRLNGSSSHTYTRGSVAHQLNKELDNIRNQRNKLERRKKASGWEKNLLYPIVMLILLAGTTLSVIMVALNILYLLVDETAMPKGSTDRGIGNTSLSTFGVAQAVLEIILMFYLMVSSVVGFYSLRVFEGLTPSKDDTTMTTIIGCCVSILVLSSALPVMSRTLGITRFDLLGDFGRFNWLGNFYIVLSYNLLFAVVTTLSLIRKFTSAVREELLKALGLDKLQLSNSPSDPESGKLSANGHQKTL